jgi:hypothetical protein
MRDYDDWKLSSGNEGKVFCHCDECSEPIYVGEEYMELETRKSTIRLHTEGNCYENFVEDYFEVKFKEAR